MGKGCKRRPIEIGAEEFEENWNNIFKRNGKNDEVMRHKRKKKWEKDAKDTKH